MFLLLLVIGLTASFIVGLDDRDTVPGVSVEFVFVDESLLDFFIIFCSTGLFEFELQLLG